DDIYTAGWEAVREARYQRQIAMGLIDRQQAPLSTRFHPEKSWEENPDQDWDARAMACHAAMILMLQPGRQCVPIHCADVTVTGVAIGEPAIRMRAHRGGSGVAPLPQGQAKFLEIGLPRIRHGRSLPELCGFF
ncbi:MAG: hypothetical protein L0H83_11110, partial [Salinisphaera sp.]|nr:hypothetical protein [Salinisphaera sp.]